MVLVTNARVLFMSIPSGYPEPGKTTIFDESEKLDLETAKLSGGFLVKTLYLSVDPYFRGRMREPQIESYLASNPLPYPAFRIGKPIEGYGIGVVLRSDHSGVKKGDYVYGIFLHQQYNLYPNPDMVHVVDNKYHLSLSAFIGPAGMPAFDRTGKTAYMAWKKYSNAKKGEIVFVSAGAGPVGSLVIQLAKMDGAKVIASAGSEEKVQFMKEIGADVVFNYKTTDTDRILQEEGPIDIYWDNVGGDTLSAALEAARIGARFIICGMISGYNTGGVPVKNLDQIFAKSLTLQGFIVTRLEGEFDKEFYEVMPRAISEGKIKWREEVWEGLNKVGDPILAIQKGQNKAKTVVRVAPE